MKVLITGSRGFLGDAFVEYLRKRNIPYSIYNRSNPEKVSLDFDSVVNFGGITPNSETNGEPLSLEDYYSANVGGTEELLKNIVKNENLKRFVNIGTAAEYGFSDTPINEDFEEKPIGPYGSSKLEQGRRLEQFSKNGRVKVVNLRLFNVAGLPERSKKEKDVAPNPFIFESLIHQFGSNLDGKIVIGNKSDVRDYVDLEDIMEAVLMALKAKDIGQYEVINICSGVGTKLEDVVELFGKILEKKYEIYATSEKEGTRSVGVNDKARRMLSWQPTTLLKESIKKMIW